MSLANRALSGSFASAVGFALTFAQAILVVPILLDAWGEGGYGLWLALLSAQALLTAADVGHQNYIGNAFNGDVHAAPGVLRKRLASALGAGFMLGIVQCLICAGLWFGGGLPALLGVEPELIAKYHVSESLMILAMVWAIFGTSAGILVRLYAPYGLFARGQWVSTAQRVGQLGLLMGVALAGGGFLAYAWGFALYSVVVSAFWFPALRRAIPAVYPWWRGFSLGEAWRNLRASGWLTAGSILANLSGNGINLLLAALLSANAIPAFSTLRTVANVGFQFAVVLVNPLYPDIVQMALAKDHGKLAQTFAVIRIAAGLPLCLGLIAVGPFIEPLFRWWTRGHVEFSPWLYAVLVLAVLVRTLGTPFGAYLTALNHVRSLLVVTIVQLVSLLIVAGLLVYWLGVLAFGLGVLAGELVGMIISYRACNHMDRETFEVDGRLVFGSLWLPLLVMTAYLALAALVRPGFAIILGIVAAVIILITHLRVVRQLPLVLKQKLTRFAPGPFRVWLERSLRLA